MSHKLTEANKKFCNCQSKTHNRHGLFRAGSYRRRSSFTITIVSCCGYSGRWRFTCVLQAVHFIRHHSFLRQIIPDSASQFAKFHNLPRQIFHTL